MKKILFAMLFAFSSTGILRAQGEPPAVPPPADSKSSAAGQAAKSALSQEPASPKPDNPIPMIPNRQDGPMPCPSGIGKPCALLGGRLYFSDPIHMTEHNLTWAQAARNPGMIVADALNLAATVADVEGTESCLRAHVCKEMNPLLGHTPNRARAYGTVLPIDFALYSLAAWMKKQGQGNSAFALLWCTTVAHTYFAAYGFAISNDGSPLTPSSSKRQNFGVTIRF